MRIATTLALWTVLAAPAWAINGNDLPLNSGTDSGTNAQLDNNGYAGTYITLASQGDVTVTVNASGTDFGGVNPRMNIVLADSKAEFDVTPSSIIPYSHIFEDMPAGTYFVRTEFPNDGGTGRALSINSLDVDGATMLNSTVDADLKANALATADTYIENYRKGPTKVSLVGVAPGTSVEVTQKREAFNWGTNIHGTSDTGLLNANPMAGSNAQKYQDFVLENFNMVEGSNAGKWTTNENSRDGSVTTGMAWQDTILAFADQYGMGARMHALVWGTQQPTWATNLLSDPTGTDTYNAGSNSQGTNLNKLDALYSDLLAPVGTPSAGEPSEIHERINYYVGDGVAPDRAKLYTELDVYNESYHTGVNGGASSIWNRYGAAGVAKIYDDVAAAVELADADVRLYLNEFSVLENQGGDAYANWYRANIEAVENGDDDPFDKTVSGIGIQYYSHGGHSSHTMMRALQNLSVLDLPMTLTEFGVQGSVTDDTDRIRNMEEAHRMLFGTPNATGFLYWGWWASATDMTLQGSGVLVEADLTTLTPVGVEWKKLRDSWKTHYPSLTVGDDGTIDFSGFYGDYEVKIGDTTYDLQLTKGDTLQSIVVAPGDYNGDHVVDAADYTVWRNSLDIPGDLRADGNGDEMIDSEDYDVWKMLYGTVYPMGSGASTTVPEPASAMLLAIGVLVSAHCKRRRNWQAEEFR